jgi:hypothetical protein
MADLRPSRLPAWLIVVGATAVSMVWKVGMLAEPPHGEHAWRDATGIGVARGFLYESWDLLRPRVAERMGGNGVAGMELPLVPWLSAALMRMGGDTYLLARLPVWLSMIGLACAALALARRILRDETAACVAAACVVLQPLVIVFSRKLMPEIPMLALLVAGAAWAIDAVRGSWPKAALAAVALALAATLKPTGPAIAVIVLPAALDAWRRSPGARLGLVGRGLIVVGVPLAAAVAWFAHARALDAASGFSPVKLEHDWLEWTHLLFDPTFLSVVFGRVLHLFLLWPTVIWMVLRRRTAIEVLRDTPGLLAWAVASMAVVVLFGSHNYQHAYYVLPATIPFAFWAGGFSAREAQDMRVERVLAVYLVIFAKTALVRANPRMPPLAFDAERLETALRAVPIEQPALVTDGHSPVISLVTLRRYGWALPAEAITPEVVETLRHQGARQLIESAFGGWLSPHAREALPAPAYADDQVRIYRLP